ncbi:AbrB/MazE/SpoVT family DNA-binding domain-containing protein [Pandoraea pnomenusa]|uniref:AbrB/MazE/SpoVT family DNA-binding domain-containing protein n=1 Tax=Pandoraea pnomenusa TaxID=93220 RepID=UPI0009C116C9|nr:AbrB/MazE/SpoVT family DNA-binding domain-containing protein [Pandoraea pnomenusa]
MRRIAVQSRIDARGRTTVPAAVRKALGAKPGTRLTWLLMPDGYILVRAKSGSILELAGALKSDASIDVEQMNPWRD